MLRRPRDWLQARARSPRQLSRDFQQRQEQETKRVRVQFRRRVPEQPDWLRERAQRRRLRPGRARLRRRRDQAGGRHLRDQDRSAFCREERSAGKCNRAERCADRPISARGRSHHTPGGPAGCGNKRNRSRHKPAPRAAPCRTAASDKYRCPLRPTVDRGCQSEGWARPSSQARRRQRCRRYRGRAVAVLSSVSASFTLEWIQKGRDTGGAAKAEQHQSKVKGKNEMRHA